MKKAAEFLNSIESWQNVIIVFHNDGDGICSAALVKKVLKEKGISPLLISQPMPVKNELISKIQTTIPNKIIFVDLAIDQQIGILKKLTGMSDILIIDHHDVGKDMNSEEIVHYNPRMENPSIYQSASYCTFKICSEIMEMNKHLWIAALGMVSDYDLSDSQDLVKIIKEKYSVKELYESDFGLASDMISASKAMNIISCEEIVEIVNNYDNLESFIKNEKMKVAYEKMEEEKKKIIDDSENSEVYQNLIIYELKSEYNLRSPISTILGEKNPDKLVVINQIEGNKMKISSRNQNANINAAKIMQRASEGLKSTGGGHPTAAGATMAKEEWKKFKENLIRLTS